MAVIKCSNCENEILDTEIVCPYCDCPVSVTKEKLNSGKAAPKKIDIKPINKAKSGSDENDIQKDDIYDADNGESDKIDDKSGIKIGTSSDFKKEQEILKKNLGITEDNERTVKISMDYVRSECVHDEKKSETEDNDSINPKKEAPESYAKRSSGGKSENKKTILIITAVGIVVIIVLVICLVNAITNMIGSTTKVNKTTTKISSSAEENEDKGFEYTTPATLTITDDDVMTDYVESDKKPWDDKADTIRHIVIKSGVTRVGSYSFDSFKSLEDVVIADTVTEIGEGAFYGCESLKNVKLSKKIKSIDDYAFTGCGDLREIKFYDSLEGIGEGAFKSCTSLDEVEIPEKTTVGNEAFFDCDSMFTIICYKDSDAYNYAVKNGVNYKVKLADGTVIGDETSTVLPTDTTGTDSDDKTGKKDPGTKTEDKNENDKNNTQTSGNGQTSSETNGGQSASGNGQSGSGSSKSDKVSQLMQDLQKATTQEEKDKILKQIDEASK